MSIHRISRHRLSGTTSNPYLRYQQALRLSAAAQVAYAASHPDHETPGSTSQIHERGLNQLVELQQLLDGWNVNVLV